MGTHEGDFAFLTRALSGGISLFRRAIAAAEGTEPRRGIQLCRYLSAALDAIENRADELKAVFDEASDDADRSARVSQLRFLNIYLRSLHDAAPWLEVVRTSPYRVGLLYFLDQASEALLGGEADPILYGDAGYMYSTLPLRGPFEALLQDLGGELPEGRAPLVINCPAQEIDAILLHPVLVHELGHDAVQSRKLIELVYGRHPKLDDLNTRFNKAVEDFANIRQQAGDQVSSQEAALLLRPILNGWLEEIVCDQMALAYVGPSFVFAAVAFLFPVESGPSSTHPPASIRTRLLLDTSKELGWEGIVESGVGEIGPWLRSVADELAPDDEPPYMAFLREALIELAPAVRAVVTEQLGDEVYRHDEYTKISTELNDMLGNNILPAQDESGASIDARAILIAGWLYRLSLEGNTPASIPAAFEDQALQAFLTKAIEMSVVLERWRTL